MTKKELLPLGSIVLLEEGMQKLMIISRGVVFEDDKDQDAYTDYAGAVYPEGFNTENSFFFNHENIDKVIFEGYTDDDETRFMELYSKWESELDVPKKKF